MRKRKENKKMCISASIKEVAVGMLYALPILCLVLSAFRVGLSEHDLYVTFTSQFNFNFVYDCLSSVLSEFDIIIDGTNISIALSVFSWWVLVGLLDCVYDVFDFLISMFQSFIHKGL